MRNTCLFVTAVILLSGTTISAQSQPETQTTRNEGKVIYAGGVRKSFNIADITYSPVTMRAKEGTETDIMEGDAVSLNWVRADLLSVGLPLYIQYGTGLQYSFYTTCASNYNIYGQGYSYTDAISFLTIRIPVNLLIAYTIQGTHICLMPHAGFNFKVHLLGRNKSTYEYYDISDMEQNVDIYDLFSKSDMEVNKIRRFVAGWQIGTKVSFGRFSFGFAYEGPMTSLLKYRYEGKTLTIKDSQFNISAGIIF